MKFQSINTFKLNKKHIYQILRLKDSHWKFGYKSQLNWFERNIKSYDIHNFLYLNKKLLGYTCLRKRTFILNSKNIKYLLFDSLIIKKEMRKNKLSINLMNFNNKIIRKKKKIFLICKKSKINFYKFYKWKLINKKNFLLKGHNTKLKAMIYNLNADVHCKYVFYFNS